MAGQGHQRAELPSELSRRQYRGATSCRAEVGEDTDLTYAINMTRCQFAEYFRAIGAADVGAPLTCGVDFAAEGVLRPDWEFHRTHTLMGGASHSDFRWRLRDSADQRG